MHPRSLCGSFEEPRERPHSRHSHARHRLSPGALRVRWAAFRRCPDDSIVRTCYDPATSGSPRRHAHYRRAAEGPVMQHLRAEEDPKPPILLHATMDSTVVAGVCGSLALLIEVRSPRTHRHTPSGRLRLRHVSRHQLETAMTCRSSPSRLPPSPCPVQILLTTARKIKPISLKRDPVQACQRASTSSTTSQCSVPTRS